MTASSPACTTRLELLRQLFAAATHEASAAMCRWTEHVITMTVDEVCELPIEEAPAVLNMHDRCLTVVLITVPGELGGDLLLAFDEQRGRRLAATLLGRAPEECDALGELALSALAETGNILGCAYLNALSRLLDVELIPGPPCLVHDYWASVLQQVLLTQASTADQLLVCRTNFDCATAEMDWQTLFVPTPALQQRLEQSLQRCSAAGPETNHPSLSRLGG
jgi:chemotaxis protein CheC